MPIQKMSENLSYAPCIYICIYIYMYIYNFMYAHIYTLIYIYNIKKDIHIFISNYLQGDGNMKCHVKQNIKQLIILI